MCKTPILDQVHNCLRCSWFGPSCRPFWNMLDP